MTTRDTIEKLCRRFVLEHNSEEFHRALHELLAPNVRMHEYLPGVPASMDRHAYEGFVAAFRAAMPDIRNTVEEVVVDGDRAAVRWIGSGTHTGDALMGIPARGGRVRAQGVYVLRFDEEHIAEAWSHWDTLNVIEQLKG